MAVAPTLSSTMMATSSIKVKPRCRMIMAS
jgi:hypothetical protein